MSNPGGWGDGVTFTQPPVPTFLTSMISIHRCQLINDQWQRIERLHLPHGFDSMASATEYAEHKNRQRWPAFDWIKEPVEAFLAFRE